ncbi:RalBP1-associated Eps domain-containing protein 1 [Blomia tropicalis]|nr:RalBP1-associated Eps domain-containing protein 1 [Blomia tropicalis]
MNFNVSNVLFTKNEAQIYEDLFNRLVEPMADGGGSMVERISTTTIMQLIGMLKFNRDSLEQIVSYMKSTGDFERKNFYLLIRLAAILHSNKKITKNLICQFEASNTFIEALSTAVRKVVSERSIRYATLPPPPSANKTKLKRVHTISGMTTNDYNSNNNNDNNNLNEANNNNIIINNNNNGNGNGNGNVGGSGGGDSIYSSTCTMTSTTTSFTFTNSAFDCAQTESNSQNVINTATLNNNNNNNNEVTPVDSHNENEYDFWRINTEQRIYYRKQFLSLQPNIQGTVYVVLRRNRVPLPDRLPSSMLDIFSKLESEGYRRNILQTSTSSASISSLSESSSIVQIRNSMETIGISNSNNNNKNGPIMFGLSSPPLPPPVPPHNNSAPASTTKHWTQFDSPVPSIIQPSIPLNFDYDNSKSIVDSNPQIVHPVAVRLSPNSENPKSPSSIKKWTDGHNLIDENCTTISLPDDLEEQLIERYQPLPEVILPKKHKTTDELHDSIHSLQLYAVNVTKQNRQLLDELISLIRLIRSNSCRLSTNSN